MVASPPRRQEGNALASFELGQRISEAVELFAAARGWGPESYDLWYHGEPVWYIRHDRRDKDTVVDATKTERVQVAPFRTSAGAELVVMPDAFQYDWRERRITFETPEEWSAQNRVTVPLPEIDDQAHHDPDRARERIRGMIDDAWRAVHGAWDVTNDVPIVPVT